MPKKLPVITRANDPFKLKPSIKKRWIDALRSGRYIQGRHALCRVRTGKKHDGKISSYEFCCLGVLAEELGLEWDEPEASPLWADLDFSIEGNPGELPLALLPYEGLQKELTLLNDEKRQSFRRIATWIEENL
jgi:hypothetical protein